MVIRTDLLIEAAAMICEKKGFQVTIKSGLAGGLMVGAGAAAASMMTGPKGLFWGGALAGLGSYLAYKDSFQPLATVIRNELSPVQRKILIEKLELAFCDIEVNDMIQLTSLIMRNETLIATTTATILNFATNELSLQVQG